MGQKFAKIGFLSPPHLLSIFLGISLPLLSYRIEGQQIPFQEECQYSCSNKPPYEISTLGAPTSGALIEGVVGSINRGCRHRFYCYSADPMEGFLGPQMIAKPLSIKNQPGVFPAPLVGPASLTFSFNCQQSDVSLIPVVIKPDGTILQGLPMKGENSPQALVIPSPAQKGIYTLFVLDQSDFPNKEISAEVDATASTQPELVRTFRLKAFDPNSGNAGLFSAEFFYTPQN